LKFNNKAVIVLLTLFAALVIGYSPRFEHQTTPYPFPKLHFFPPMPVNTDNPVTVEGALLGRYLFYDTLLSNNNNMSCGSCHRQEAAFSDSPHKFSMGSDAKFMKRNTPPLFNLAWYPVLFWDGRASNIEDQVLHPLRSKSEMNLSVTEVISRLNSGTFYRPLFYKAFGVNKIDSTHLANALGQFLRTLISYNSKFDRVIRRETVLDSAEHAGFVLANEQNKGNCLHCHSSDADVLGTTTGFSNNGLDKVISHTDFKDPGRGGVTGKAEDYGKFKIPSLRNIALTSPYMHDGRFMTLNDVVAFYNDSIRQSPTLDHRLALFANHEIRLTNDEQIKIIAFLNTLTDSVFIKNPEFSNPFR
jgi:cytochrome c peroxidase